MSDATLPSILLVLDSAPEEPGAPNYQNAWIAELVAELGVACRLSLFYPVLSVGGPFYRLRREERGGVERFSTVIPYKYPSFAETYDNPEMDRLFAAVIGERAFDAVHILSLRNHSFGYPETAWRAGLPVLLSIFDGWLRCPCRYLTGCEGKARDGHRCRVKLSNFVATPISFLVKRVEHALRAGGHHWWFEETGRYSAFYNRGPCERVGEESFTARDRRSREMLPYVDAFHFPSEDFHKAFFSDLVPSQRAFFMAQGIPAALVVDSRPFEIPGGVRFGFIGDIVPEEGLTELVAAFNALRERGLPNSLHLYGELYRNEGYVNKLRKECHNGAVLFQGAVDPGRIGAVLDSFDVLVLPSRWPRPDSWLAAQAMARRKAVIAPAGTAAAELIRKRRRGVVLKNLSARDLEQIFVDLEIDRKKLYYLMRIAEREQFLSMAGNARDLLTRYRSLMKRPARTEEKVLRRRLNRKRTERSRGAA
ncbi:MAG TPA: glycosyltransferase [bacterium]|nr:glycosyltransferase [bacterium]